MGEMADMLLSGFLCSSCGQMIDWEITGYPRECEDCLEEKER